MTFFSRFTFSNILPESAMARSSAVGKSLTAQASSRNCGMPSLITPWWRKMTGYGLPSLNFTVLK
jgi:hypothetical protein